MQDKLVEKIAKTPTEKLKKRIRQYIDKMVLDPVLERPAEIILHTALTNPDIPIIEIDPDAELPENPNSTDVHLDAGVYDGLMHGAVEEYKELLTGWKKEKK